MPFRRTPGPRLISLYSSYTCHSKDEFMYIYTSPIYKQQKQQSFHMFRPLMWTRETNEWQQHTRSKVKGSSLGCCGEHKHTHTPSIIQQRVDERACSCGWRTGMGGCWESERGYRARGRETDNKRPALPQSSKEPFQQSVYQSKRAYGVHTVCIQCAYSVHTVCIQCACSVHTVCMRQTNIKSLKRHFVCCWNCISHRALQPPLSV